MAYYLAVGIPAMGEEERDSVRAIAALKLAPRLITYNNDKEKAKALAQLDQLRSTVKNAQKFAEAALRHSQCPIALEGGKLGIVKRAQLYAELEPAAFALAEGEISALLESPIGLHIVRCDEILSPGNPAR